MEKYPTVGVALGPGFESDAVVPDETLLGIYIWTPSGHLQFTQFKAGGLAGTSSAY